MGKPKKQPIRIPPGYSLAFHRRLALSHRIMQMATLTLSACRATLARGSNSFPWEEQTGKKFGLLLPEMSVRRIESASFVLLSRGGAIFTCGAVVDL